MRWYCTTISSDILYGPILDSESQAEWEKWVRVSEILAQVSEKI